VDELILRPKPVTRVANAFFGIAVTVPAIGGTAAVMQAMVGESVVGTVVLAVLMPVILVCGPLLSWRGYRLGVTCRPGEIEVRGYLRTTRISVASIVAIYVFDAEVYWQPPSGEPKRVSITAFKNGPKTAAPIRRYHDEVMTELQHWWRANRGERPSAPLG